MKKGLLILLTALLLLCCSTALAANTAAFYDEETGQMELSTAWYVDYTVLEDGTARLDSLRPHGVCPSTIILPSKVDGYTITAINGKHTLSYLDNAIHTVKIPPTITRILNDPEGGWGESLNIRESVRYIEPVGEDNAFSVEDNGLIYLGTSLVGCFPPAENTSIAIRPGTTRVNLSAFCDAEKVVGIYIPASVTEVYYEPHKELLAEVPSSLKEFIVEEGNPVYFASQGVLYSRDAVICCPPDVKELNIVIPEGIREIKASAFCRVHDYFSSAMTLRLPQSMEIIRRSAFSDMMALTTINIPAGVHTIEEGAFSCCVFLSQADVDPANPRYIVRDKLLIDQETATVLLSLEATRVPEGIRAIGDHAFSNNVPTGSITLPDSLESIGAYAFANNAMQTLELPSAVAHIGEHAFDNCGLLQTVSFRNNQTSLTSIPNNAFYFCGQLKKVVIPADAPIKSIGEEAFYLCEALTDITLPNQLETIGKDAFHSCERLRHFTIPASVKTLNVNESFWGSPLRTLIIMGDTKLTGFDPYPPIDTILVSSRDAASWCSKNDVEYEYLYRWFFKRGDLIVTKSSDPEVQSILDAGGSMKYTYSETSTPTYTYYKNKRYESGAKIEGAMTVTLTTADGRTSEKSYACKLTGTSIQLDDNLLEYTLHDYRTITLHALDWTMQLEGAELE